MKLVNFVRPGEAEPAEVGLYREGQIVPLCELIPGVQRRPLGAGAGVYSPELAEPWRAAVDGLDPELLAGASRFSPQEVRWLPPVWPAASFRDFYAFEEHVKTARGRRGLEMVPQWYHFPVFYFSNADALLGHGAEVEVPPDGEWLDFELEVAAIIGKPGRNIAAERAEEHIAGYAVLNDWSARKVQREEMAVGLGPAKGKDFATSLGPALVTLDELQAHRADKGFDLAMTASVNGQTLSRGNWRTISYSFAEMIARASRGVWLRPGDVLGSGTVGTGCILELGLERAGRWLRAGDEVELHIEGLGRLNNRIVEEQR